MTNPWDHSEIILANSAGARLGAGIERAAESLGRALQQYGQSKVIATQASPSSAQLLTEKESKPEKRSPLALLIAERDAANQAGRPDIAGEYDRVIRNYGTGSADVLAALFGNKGGEPDPLRDPTVHLPRPASREERDRLPAGTRYLAPDGSVRTR